MTPTERSANRRANWAVLVLTVVVALVCVTVWNWVAGLALTGLVILVTGGVWLENRTKPRQGEDDVHWTAL